jgi:hypothetical protein
MPVELRQRPGDVAGLKQLQRREASRDQQGEPLAVEGVGFYQQYLHPRELGAGASRGEADSGTGDRAIRPAAHERRRGAEPFTPWSRLSASARLHAP